MKRRDFLAFLFFLLAFLFPGTCLISKLLDYTLLVHSGRHFAVLSTLLYGILGILLLHREEKTAGAVSAVLLSLCPFLNQINVTNFGSAFLDCRHDDNCNFTNAHVNESG